MPDGAGGPALVVFAGLPGAGKSTLARGVARHLGAAYLRVDSVEQALRESGALRAGVGVAGYAVLHRAAADTLALGTPVAADAVHPVAASRDAWRETAAAAGARLVEVEVVCSDPGEHRRRVENRAGDVPGLVLPTWADVLARAAEYEPWGRPRVVVDTAGRTPEVCLTELLSALSAR